jgi:hypothetical protein
MPLIALAQENPDQQEVFDQEIRIVVDNDVFTSFYRDQYYSSGLFGYYRTLRPTDGMKYKLIRSFGISQRIYTPERLTTRDPDRMDRPYAGILSGSFSNEYYYISGKYLKTSLELGWLGPANQTGTLHEFWHEVFDLPTPRGWNYQIQDMPLLNVNVTYASSLWASH